VGFIVPRYQQTAVARNQLKRRLRELTRIELLPTLAAIDVVIRVSPRAYRQDFDTLKAEMLELRAQLARIA
jgi:ribonuclease P protein component